jgi:hypothetical protein
MSQLKRFARGIVSLPLIALLTVPLMRIVNPFLEKEQRR